MKKIINRPENVVPEMLSGIAHVNPDVVFEQKYRIIRRKELKGNKVALISGGGSGHEPAHAGYVGKGMLDAAVCGDVFASPSQIQVYQGIKSVAGDKGVLLIIKNYSGDVMNFTNAAEMAKEEGIPVEWVKVEDDIAVTDSLYTVGRRGVAGTVLVHKAAGAAAESGLKLDEVKRIAQKAADHVRTIGAGYTSCTVPASGVPTFDIGEGEMEYGVGIHGEPGRCRERILDASELASRMVMQIIEDLHIEKDDEAVLLVNGFGSTPLQELFIMNYEVARLLDEAGIHIYRGFAGNYMTSIDMMGCSVSLMKLDDELKQYIDEPCYAPHFRVDGPVKMQPFTPLQEKKKELREEMLCEEAWKVIKDQRLTVQNLAAIVCGMCCCILENEKSFCKLDSYAGDGDFGMSIAKGFREVKREWDELLKEHFSTVKEFLLACSMIIMENCGGASGPLWGSAFRSAALQAGDRAYLTLPEFADMMQAAAAGIQKTGERSFGRGAVIGDKTLIDALIPCVQAVRTVAEQGGTWENAFKMGAVAAVNGAEETKNIVARMGRAGTVGERSLGYPDAGAYALGVIFTEIAEFMQFVS
ncbi:dihydroxyacetone kinase subunit DhaK [Faecalicatena orotica]|uniref:phosphoenolpyruvate--glycerone phosphotransferase n=1 Tax=Faecalicatena orotica TaxID=1544 RepID=A0A2Y9B989_9FIRM|nr:dihydroxyacetone kinase subunit DhaK [Faecalicatena orotica]PWJ31234.1 homodimeric dihydroxyacetone kinase [Faecalicatena orotica]SSA54440.1 homodimeric dihydroxyacetone kinase [Faecalicatena orotica]